MVVQNIVLAVGNKDIEQCYKNLPDFEVTHIFRKRERLIDDILRLKEPPAFLVISEALAGKTNLHEIIVQLQELRPQISIVFLYGPVDEQYTAMAEFLIAQKVYSIVAGEITESVLHNALKEEYSQEHALATLQKNRQNMTTEIERKTPVPPIAKEIERTVIQTHIIGTIKIAISSIFPRAGCTNFALELAAYLTTAKIDVGIVVSEFLYVALKDYYMVNAVSLVVEGVHFYTDFSIAVNKHKVIVYDIGQLSAGNESDFYSIEYKILLCPSQPWEIDQITNFATGNQLAHKINFVFWPISEKFFREIERQFVRKNMLAYQYNFNPEPLTERNIKNVKMFEEITHDILTGMKQVPPKGQKRRFFRF